MLSGFVFDLRNVPLVIQVVAQLLPATHFMGLIKTLFLAGDHGPTILRSVAILSLYAVVLVFAVVFSDPPRILLLAFLVYAASGPIQYLLHLRRNKTGQ